MCFIIAKNFNKTGAVALQVCDADELLALEDRLSARLDMDKIQLVAISRPSAFGEYAPYQFAADSSDFERLALAL